MADPVRPVTAASLATRWTLSAQVPADVLIRRYRRPQNAISIARVSSRWKLGVGFSLIKKLL